MQAIGGSLSSSFALECAFHQAIQQPTCQHGASLATRVRRRPETRGAGKRRGPVRELARPDHSVPATWQARPQRVTDSQRLSRAHAKVLGGGTAGLGAKNPVKLRIAAEARVERGVDHLHPAAVAVELEETVEPAAVPELKQ